MQDFERSFRNLDAECSALGGFMLDNATLRHATQLSTDDFAFEATSEIFSAIQSLMLRKESVDLVTLDAELTRRGKLGDVGGLSYLIEISQHVPSAANTEAYVKIVKDMSARRRIRDVAQQALDAISDPGSDTQDVLGRSRQALRDIGVTGHHWISMQDLLLNTYAHIDKVQRGEIKPIHTGINTLDRMIGGFFPGELTIVGAGPAVGKSAFAINAAVQAARDGFNVCIVSLEMSGQQFGQRLLSKGSRVDGMRLRTGDLDVDAWAALAETMQRQADLPISYLFTANRLEDIVAEAQSKADEGKLDMLIVDYLQLTRTRQKLESKRLEISHICYELKQLAKDLNIPILLLSQLSRPEKGRVYMPRMSDLRESGDIEASADGIILLHRADAPDDPGVDKRDREGFDLLTGGKRVYIRVIVEKQRQGDTGRLAVLFDPSVMEYKGIRRD